MSPSEKKSNPPLIRWTRGGEAHFGWSPFETEDRLLLAPAARDFFQELFRYFENARERFHREGLVWSTSLFLYGPSGSGKTAFSRAIARRLQWGHYTIPAHEILDAHFLEAALAQALSGAERVIVLEDVDQTVRRMDAPVFFELLDHAMGRADSVIWVATSQDPARAPKTQLLRPSRFEQSLRMELPSLSLRRTLLADILQEPENTPSDENGSALSDSHEEAVSSSDSPDSPTTMATELAELTQGLSFSHFEELRRVAARGRILGESREELLRRAQEFCTDQLIASDRFGGASALQMELDTRVAQVDPRILLASLELTDVFKKLIEKSISDAIQQDQREITGGSQPTA
jgi:SpoVK/Ycf46/Vps4 family AAA+-type ATPase